MNVLESVRLALSPLPSEFDNADESPLEEVDGHRLIHEFDVALSFAGEDRQYVEQVACALKGHNVSVFYDRYEEALLWGEDLSERLAAVYGRKAEYVIVFISRHYAEKVWTNHERQIAQARAIREGINRVLPARFDDTEIPGVPATVGYIDLRLVRPEELAEKIRRKLQARRQPAHG